MTLESLLRDALHARDEWRYRDVVAVVDPASMREYFTTFCRATRPRTREMFAAQFRDLSGDQLARSYARWLEVTPDPVRMIAQQVAGISTHAELVALTPESFLERTLMATDPRFQTVERMRQRGEEVPVELRITPAHIRYDIIGSVLDGEEYAHVLHRTLVREHSSDISRARIEIESARRQPDGSWRFLAGWGYDFLRTRHSVVTFTDDDGLLDDEVA